MFTPNGVGLDLLPKNSKSILPPLMEQVWNNKKIGSKGWKLPLLPRWNEFRPKGGKN